MEDRIEKAILEITELLDLVAFEEPTKWQNRKRQAKRDGNEPPIPGDGTGWLAPTSWQGEEAVKDGDESEIRYNEETDELELAMRHTNACSCCADKPMYLQWMTVPELVKTLREKRWIVFQNEDRAVTAKIIKKLEAFHKKFKRS